MFDYNYLCTLARGEERLAYLKKCIAEADNEKNIREMLTLRHDYMQESTFYGDKFQMILMFPEFLKLYEENPDVVEPDCALYPFEWMIEDCSKYWQVTREQIDSYIERFGEFLKKYGYDMTQYHLRRSGAYDCVDMDKANEYLHDFEVLYESVKTEDDINAESSRIYRDMRTGDVQGGLDRLNELLKTHDISEFPYDLFGDIAYYLAKEGYYDEADHYADTFLRFTDKSEWVGSLFYLSECIIVKTLTDIHRAYDIFCEAAGIYSKAKNPASEFMFALSAYRLMYALEKQGVNELHSKLSSDFELYDPDRNYVTAKLKEHFYKAADDLARKFDKRNGNTMFSDILSFEFPDAPESKLELPLHGTVTPERFSIGVLFRNELPAFDDIAKVLTEKLGFDNVSANADESGNSAYIPATDKDGTRLMYGVVCTDAPDISEYHCYYDLPEHTLDNIGDYTKMLVLISDNIHTDRYEDIRRMTVLADAMNTDGCPVLCNIIGSVLYPAEWLKYVVISGAPPVAVECLDLRTFNSEAVPGTVDVLSLGLSLFGSRELAVIGVTREEYSKTIWLLRKLVETLSFSPLPDEGVTMNSGILYDDRGYMRFTWKQRKFSDSDRIFAEPVIYLTKNSEGIAINKISDEDMDKLTPRQNYKSMDLERIRSRSLFPYALEYFKTHDCGMRAGIDVTYTDEDGDEQQTWLHVALEKDGKTGVVENKDKNVTQFSIGDKVEVIPGDVYYFGIFMDDNDIYYADDLYLLLREDNK